MLNSDQEKARKFILNWWRGSRAYCILEGRGGVGKTYLLLELLNQLPNCVPLLTAPSNEAVRQMEKVCGDKYELRTTFSALGYGFDTSKEVKNLKQLNKPLWLDNYNLLVVDEGSMLGEDLWDSIEEAGIRCLVLGHRNQLPEVNVNLGSSDRCDSFIFTKNYPHYLLTEPVRNTGKLFEFCNHVESLIETKPRILKSSGFGITIADFEQSLKGDGLEPIKQGAKKVIGYTNALADSLNTKIRHSIYSSDRLLRYIASDRILITAPCKYIGNIAGRKLSSILRAKSKALALTSNTNFKVDVVRECEVLGVECFGLTVLRDNGPIELFVPIFAEQKKELYKKLLHEAYGKVSVKSRTLAFQNLHFIMSLFAQVKHSYAITAHRSQGMTLESVVVRYDDIKKCNNVYLKHKLLYVAASRASKKLEIIL